MQKEVAWYVVDVDGQRHGPLPANEVLAMLARQRIHSGSLAWREGMAQWQPLSSVQHELGGTPPTPPDVPMRATDPVNPFAITPGSFAASDDYPQQGEVVYAGFAKRLLAYTIDTIIVYVIMLVLVFVAGLIFAGHSTGNRTTALGFFYLTIPLIALLYYPLQESSSAQATFGKRALGIKVTTLEGERIGLGRAFGRLFSKILSGLVFFIGYIMAGFTERKQALHDMVASTLVVDRWAFTRYPARQRRTGGGIIVAAVLVGALVFGIVPIMAAIAIPQYQTYVTRAAVARARNEAEQFKPQVLQAFAAQHACPSQLEGANTTGNPAISDIATGAYNGDAGSCAIQVTFSGQQRPLTGTHLWLVVQPGADPHTWHCLSDAPAKYLGTTCSQESASQGP